MELHWVHPEVFDADERTAAEERIRSLAEGRTDLIDVRITARTSGHHRHGGLEVRVVCQVRGDEIVAARTRPDARLALNEVLDAFEREVHRLRERRQSARTAQPVQPPELGVVDELRRGEGFGFILTDGGERVYFHRNAVKGGLAFDRLEDGQRVGLNYEGGREGLQATAVVEPPPDAPAP